MEEYLKTVLEQIRCRKAQALVAQELRGHMEDQIEKNKREGMSEPEAVEAAVRDMGDPVETGVSMDWIHRPQIAWSVIAIMAVISLASMLVQLLMGYQETLSGGATDPISQVANASISVLGLLPRKTGFILMGFAVMLIVYRIDYSFFGKYAKILAAVFNAVLFINTFYTGASVKGAVSFLHIGSGFYLVPSLMMLYIPLYGALLYQYRGSGASGIFKMLLWMLVPSFCELRIPAPGHALMLFFMMAVLLSAAVWKGWFRISQKKFLGIFWGVLIGIPAVMLPLSVKLSLMAAYQQQRIESFLKGSPSEYDYVGQLLRKYLMESRFLGNSGSALVSSLPDYRINYQLMFLSSYYGIAVALLVCMLVAFLIYKVFHISIHQKNQLGMIMGCGCGLVFFANTALNLTQNLGLLPRTESFLPFFTYGGTTTVVSYILVGIILSIYRYKNILPAKPGQDGITRPAAD